MILGEPFFTSALFPWHNLYFWYAASSIARIVKPGVKILPCGATLKAIAGQYLESYALNSERSKSLITSLDHLKGSGHKFRSHFVVFAHITDFVHVVLNAFRKRSPRCFHFLWVV